MINHGEWIWSTMSIMMIWWIWRWLNKDDDNHDDDDRNKDNVIFIFFETWRSVALLAPSGALYDMMLYNILARPLSPFLLIPTPYCHPKSPLQYPSHPGVSTVTHECYNIINMIESSSRNNYHMTERTNVPRRPCLLTNLNRNKDEQHCWDAGKVFHN